MVIFSEFVLTVINSLVICISLGDIMKMEREREKETVWLFCGEHARERKKERELERRNVYQKKNGDKMFDFFFFFFWSLGSE
jgi:hypothetical protein